MIILRIMSDGRSASVKSSFASDDIRDNLNAHVGVYIILEEINSGTKLNLIKNGKQYKHVEYFFW